MKREKECSRNRPACALGSIEGYLWPTNRLGPAGWLGVNAPWHLELV